MFAGGFAGESKSEILTHLRRVPGAVAPFTLVPRGSTANVDEFPAVLKPDVGERGSGVAIVWNQGEVERYLETATSDTILQRYVPGCEFGIYFVRYPDDARGRVLSITEKRFPSVTGDGRRSLRELILGDIRAVCMAAAYFRVAKRSLDSIPDEGETIPLVEIGSHCRGTVFLDGSGWITPELNARIDWVSQAHPGFYLGRYDVRAASPRSLQRGEFQIIELNGVSAEATHIYDPAIPLWHKYQVMARHWRMAFEIGAINRARGAHSLSLRQVLRIVLPPLNRQTHERQFAAMHQ
jgi:hypothetical protein